MIILQMHYDIIAIKVYIITHPVKLFKKSKENIINVEEIHSQTMEI